MVNLASLARLYDNAHFHAHPVVHQMIVHGTGCEKRRDRRHLCVSSAIAENEQAVSVEARVRRLAAQLVECLLHPVGPVLNPIKHAQSWWHALMRKMPVPNLCQVLVGEDGCFQLKLLRVVGELEKDIALAADKCTQTHDQLLADRIDGGVGHLGEVLLEIIEQKLRTIAEDGQRCIDTHGSDRVFPFLQHRGEQEANGFLRVPEHLLAFQ